MLQLLLVGLVRVSALFVRKGVSERELRHIYVKGHFLVELIVIGSVLPANMQTLDMSTLQSPLTILSFPRNVNKPGAVTGCDRSPGDGGSLGRCAQRKSVTGTRCRVAVAVTNGVIGG